MRRDCPRARSWVTVHQGPGPGGMGPWQPHLWCGTSSWRRAPARRIYGVCRGQARPCSFKWPYFNWPGLGRGCWSRLSSHGEESDSQK